MKTSGVSCETKFGLLFFLGHPNDDGDKVSYDDNASDEDDEDLPHRLLAIAKGGRVDLEAPDARGVEQERVRLAHL